MVLQNTLFDDDQQAVEKKPKAIQKKKEVTPLDKLKNLDDKIAGAIDKVKTLKEEKAVTERKMRELEEMLNDKNQEIEQLREEKNVIKNQLEALLGEIETLEME